MTIPPPPKKLGVDIFSEIRLLSPSHRLLVISSPNVQMPDLFPLCSVGSRPSIWRPGLPKFIPMGSIPDVQIWLPGLLSMKTVLI